MPSPMRPPRLRNLAAQAGFNQADLEAVSGVPHGTVVRLWNDPDWLMSASGETLTKLGSVLPVEKAFVPFALGRRRKRIDRLTRDLEASVDWSAVEGIPAKVGLDFQPVLNALEAVLRLLHDDNSLAIPLLKACWGRQQTHALDLVLGIDTRVEGLLRVPDLLSRADAMLVEMQSHKRQQFARSVAQTVLVHHLAKAGSTAARETANRTDVKSLDEQGAFVLRGNVMGYLRQVDDFDHVRRYRELVNRNGTVRGIELWAFPTWTADANMDNSFELAPSLSLKQTAAEVIREINEYNEGYVDYLVTTFIPTALDDIDDQFGGALIGLRKAVHDRRERAESKELQRDCTTLIKQLDN